MENNENNENNYYIYIEEWNDILDADGQFFNLDRDKDTLDEIVPFTSYSSVCAVRKEAYAVQESTILTEAEFVALVL
jgi:hypothetical protein